MIMAGATYWGLLPTLGYALLGCGFYALGYLTLYRVGIWSPACCWKVWWKGICSWPVGLLSSGILIIEYFNPTRVLNLSSLKAQPVVGPISLWSNCLCRNRDFHPKITHQLF